MEIMAENHPQQLILIDTQRMDRSSETEAYGESVHKLAFLAEAPSYGTLPKDSVQFLELQFHYGLW